MKTLLAYVVVIPLVQFAYTIGTYVGIPLGLWTFVLPVKCGNQARSFVAGFSGIFLAVAYGFIVFRLFLGSQSYSTFPLLATVLPLLIPLQNDYRRYRQMDRTMNEIEEAVANGDDLAVIEREMLEELHVYAWYHMSGALVGVLLGGWIFLSR